MADNAFNRNQWPDEGKNQPKPDVDVRTFGSDVKSVSESGGGSPKPYTPSPPSPPPPPQAPSRPEEKKQSFSQVFPAASPEGQEAAPAPMSFDAAGLEAEGMKPKKSPKGLFVGILVLVIVIGLAALGYFFVYPVFFGGEPEEVAEVAPPAPAPVPEVPTVPEVPVVTEEEPVPPSGEEEEPAPPAAVAEHVSLFKTAADVSTNITLPQVTVASYKAELDFLIAQVPILKEVVFKDSEGGFVSFGNFAGVILSGVFTQALNQSFEQDFTLFTYTDSKGTWPGFIVRLGSGATLADVQSSVSSSLEASGNLANLYLTNPGSQTSWGSGNVGSVSNRYLPFGLDGASLNYGWKGSLLVVSTSFPGFQEALNRLE